MTKKTTCEFLFYAIWISSDIISASAAICSNYLPTCGSIISLFRVMTYVLGGALPRYKLLWKIANLMKNQTRQRVHWKRKTERWRGRIKSWWTIQRAPFACPRREHRSSFHAPISLHVLHARTRYWGAVALDVTHRIFGCSTFYSWTLQSSAMLNPADDRPTNSGIYIADRYSTPVCSSQKSNVLCDGRGKIDVSFDNVHEQNCGDCDGTGNNTQKRCPICRQPVNGAVLVRMWARFRSPRPRME